MRASSTSTDTHRHFAAVDDIHALKANSPGVLLLHEDLEDATVNFLPFYRSLRPQRSGFVPALDGTKIPTAGWPYHGEGQSLSVLASLRTIVTSPSYPPGTK